MTRGRQRSRANKLEARRRRVSEHLRRVARLVEAQREQLPHHPLTLAPLSGVPLEIQVELAQRHDDQRHDDSRCDVRRF